MTSTAYIAILVVLAYGFFFVYDIVSVRFSKAKGTFLLFATGFLLNTLAVAVLLADQLPGCPWDVLAIVFALCAAACILLMLGSLFLALPKNTYADPKQGRQVCNEGMYALCRHPGVLWYCAAFLFVALAFRTADAALACMILCAGDIAYMVFQDLWSFPRTFCDYDSYKRNVPFFLPTPTSFRQAFGTGLCGEGRL